MWDPPTPKSNGPPSPRGPHHPQANRPMALLVWLGWVPLPLPPLTHFESGPQWEKK